jgi:hypothetical protein
MDALRNAGLGDADKKDDKKKDEDKAKDGKRFRQYRMNRR